MINQFPKHKGEKRYKSDNPYKPIPKTEKKCRITGQTMGLHKHHVFGGKNRALSDKYNLYIYLSPEYHNMSDKGIHFNKKFREEVQREYQIRFEQVNGKGSFLKVFGKNYVEGAA